MAYVPNVIPVRGGFEGGWYKGKYYRDIAGAYSAREVDLAAAKQAEEERRQALKLAQMRNRPQVRMSSYGDGRVARNIEAQWKKTLGKLQSKILDIVSRGQSYSQQIMDKLVTEGLETVRWQKEKQESLFERAGEILDQAGKPISEAEVRGLSEAGTQGVLESQKAALARQEAALATRGLLGSSASEAAYAKTASTAGTQIAKLQAAAMQTATQRRHEAQMETLKTMAGIIQGSPIGSTLAELAKTGVLASQFAVPNFKF